MMQPSLNLTPPSAAGPQHPPPPAYYSPASTNPIHAADSSTAIIATHPPYEEMIISAIESLREKNGSSRQAIAKYIERVYTNLPPTHSTMLTNHLKRMKNAAILVMDKYSYRIAGSELSSLPNTAAPAAAPVADAAPPPPFTLTTSLTVTEPVSNATVFAQAPDLNGPGQEMSIVVKRGRGRPPKVRVDADGNGTVKKTAGRPRKPVSQTMSLLKHRGRPRKDAGIAPSALPSPRPGRRPKIGGTSRKSMKISGKPVGPKTIKETTMGPAEPKWMVDYMHVRVKLQCVQQRMQQAIGALKPHLSTESSSESNVAAALQELDHLSTIDIMAATFTNGEDEPLQAAEQMHVDTQAPPQPAQPNKQHYNNHEGEHVL